MPGSFDAEIILTPKGPTVVKSPSPAAARLLSGGDTVISDANSLNNISPFPPASGSKPSPPTSRPPPLPASAHARHVSVISATQVLLPEKELLKPTTPVFSLADAKPDVTTGSSPVNNHDYEDVEPLIVKEEEDLDEEDEEEDVPVTTAVLRLRVDNDVKKVKARDVKTFNRDRTVGGKKDPDYDEVEPVGDSSQSKEEEEEEKKKKDPDYEVVEFKTDESLKASPSPKALLEVPDLVKQSSKSPGIGNRE